MRFRHLLLIYVMTVLLGLAGLFLIAPRTWVGAVNVFIDPVAITGVVTGSTANGIVSYEYSVQGTTFRGTYSDSQGGNPKAKDARVGDQVHVEYARHSPVDSCGCDIKSELTNSALPYFGFYLLIVAGLVTVITFGAGQIRRRVARAKGEGSLV
jgi:hypothetical protein